MENSLPQKLKAADISYFDSHLLEGAINISNKPKKLPHERLEDEKTPTEIWLEYIKKNIIVLRRDYFSNRVPRFLS